MMECVIVAGDVLLIILTPQLWNTVHFFENSLMAEYTFR